jgi:hypothetical protein
VSAEHLIELSPWHMVAVLKSGSKVSPPGTSGPTKLLSHVHILLELGIVQQPKLGLDDVKPVIHLKRISCLSQCHRLHRQEVGVGGVHHQLVVWLVPSMVHKVLCQHPHEPVLRG